MGPVIDCDIGACYDAPGCDSGLWGSDCAARMRVDGALVSSDRCILMRASRSFCGNDDCLSLNGEVADQDAAHLTHRPGAGRGGRAGGRAGRELQYMKPPQLASGSTPPRDLFPQILNFFSNSASKLSFYVRTQANKYRSVKN